MVSVALVGWECGSQEVGRWVKKEWGDGRRFGQWVKREGNGKRLGFQEGYDWGQHEGCGQQGMWRSECGGINAH